MESVLQKLRSLNGVHDVCVCQDGSTIASTLAASQVGVMAGFLQTVEQVFAALEAIGKDHNEIYFTFAERMVAVYTLADGKLVLLLTDKKINLPLITMGVKAAASKLQSLPATASAESASPVPASPAPVAVAPIVLAPEPPPVEPVLAEKPRLQPAPPKPQPLDAATQGLLRQLESLLTGYFGPAAQLIFQDACDDWSQKHTPSRYTTGHLVNALLVEFDSEAERNDFQQRARKLINP